MNVIVISNEEDKETLVVGVVEVPEGQEAEAVFDAWMKLEIQAQHIAPKDVEGFSSYYFYEQETVRTLRTVADLPIEDTGPTLADLIGDDEE